MTEQQAPEVVSEPTVEDAASTPAPSEETTPETAEAEAKPEAPAEEVEASSDDEDSDDPKKPNRSQRLKRRIQAIAAEAAELARQNEDMRKRLSVAVDPTQGKPGVDRPPLETDFPNDYLAFDRARIAWDVRSTILQTQEAERQRTLASQASAVREERLEAYQDDVVRVRERIPDYDKVLKGARDVHVADGVIHEIMASEKPALLAYHLAQHPEAVRELNSMNGTELARAIGRLEGRVHLPKPKTATQAARPPTQAAGQSAPPTSVYDPNISMEEFVRLRDAQEKAAGKGKYRYGARK